MAYRPFESDLSGRVALVTGANSGMGKETARELARMGAQVILGCRSKQRGEAAANEIIETTGRNRAAVMVVDLSSLASVRAFARAFDERFPKLDVLVNNAAASLRAREITPEGFERHWATNVLGAHLLTKLLLPALEASGHGGSSPYPRSQPVGSISQIPSMRGGATAGQVPTGRPSRRAGCSRGRSPRLRGKPVTANALNPGYVLTDLTTNVGGILKIVVVLTSFRAQTPLDGADTAIWLAASRRSTG